MHKPWFAELGYAHNPFIIKPAFFDDEVHGYDKEIDQLVERLKDRTMNFLEGDYGLGKTSIVQYLINELKGSFRIIYVSRNKNDRAFNYDNLLRGAATGFARLFRKRARNVILFVDETEKINDHDCNQIKELFDAGHINSVLFIDKSMADARISQTIRKEIAKNVFKIKPITDKDVIALTRSRLEGNEEIIADKQIQEVFELSNKNTRSFLLNMEDIFRNVVDDGRSSVTSQDVSEFFGQAPKKKKTAVKPKVAKPKVTAEEPSEWARKMDANLIAFTEDHELDYILKKYNKRLTKDNRKALAQLGLKWKKDRRVKVHNRDAFYKFVETKNALEPLENS